MKIEKVYRKTKSQFLGYTQFQPFFYFSDHRLARSDRPDRPLFAHRHFDIARYQPRIARSHSQFDSALDDYHLFIVFINFLDFRVHYHFVLLSIFENEQFVGKENLKIVYEIKIA